MELNAMTYETYCLLYIDNELSLSDMESLEAYARENEACNKFLEALNQTKLSAPNVILEDKEMLYRFDALNAKLPNTFKESLYKQTKSEQATIIKGRFEYATALRALTAIAAILCLFIGYKYVVTSTQSGGQTMASNTKINNSSIAATKAISSTANNSPLLVANATPIVEKDNDNGPSIKNQVIRFDHSDPLTSNNIATTKEPIVTMVNNNEAEKLHNNKLQSTIALNNESTTENTIVTEKTKDAILQNAVYNNTKSKETINTETKETFENFETEDQEKTIYIANLEINADKLRGFSRRVNALFKRNKVDKEK